MLESKIEIGSYLRNLKHYDIYHKKIFFLNFYIFLLFFLFVYIENSLKSILIHAQNCKREIDDLKNDVQKFSELIKNKFNQRCKKEKICKKAYSSCDLNIIEKLNCNLNYFDKMCSNKITKNTKVSLVFPVLRFQNKYSDIFDPKRIDIATQELICSISDDEINKKLDELSQKHLKYQFIASYKGIELSYPARLKCYEEEYCPYDKPFYCLAAIGLKNIFIVIDAGILIETRNNKVSDVYIFLEIIFNSLTNFDTIYLMIFSENEVIEFYHELKIMANIKFSELCEFIKKNLNMIQNPNRKSYILALTKIHEIVEKIKSNRDLKTNQNLIFLYTNSIYKNDGGLQIYQKTSEFLKNKFLKSLYDLLIENIRPFFLIYSKQLEEAYSKDFLKDLTCQLNGLLFFQENHIEDLVSKYCIYLSNGIKTNSLITGVMNNIETGENDYAIISSIYEDNENLDFNSNLVFAYASYLDYNYFLDKYPKEVNECLGDFKNFQNNQLIFPPEKDCILQSLRKNLLRFTCDNKCYNFSKMELEILTNSHELCNFKIKNNGSYSQILQDGQNYSEKILYFDGCLENLNTLDFYKKIDKRYLCCYSMSFSNYVIIFIVFILLVIFLLTLVIIIYYICTIKLPKNQRTYYDTIIYLIYGDLKLENWNNNIMREKIQSINESSFQNIPIEGNIIIYSDHTKNSCSND